MLNKKMILNHAAEMEQDFIKYISISHEYEIKGIFNSELLFMLAAVDLLHISHIIESGRARGVSTEIISRYCAQKKIQFDSIESNRTNGDAELAEKRLKDCHVNLIYGDSFEVMPKLIGQWNIAILIDGPKGPNMLKLFDLVYHHPFVKAVFLHDSHKGSYIRNRIDSRGLKYISSDDIDFVTRFHSLDDPCWLVHPWNKYETGSYIQGEVRHVEKMESYSETLTYIGK